LHSSLPRNFVTPLDPWPNSLIQLWSFKTCSSPSLSYPPLFNFSHAPSSNLKHTVQGYLWRSCWYLLMNAILVPVGGVPLKRLWSGARRPLCTLLRLLIIWSLLRTLCNVYFQLDDSYHRSSPLGILVLSYLFTTFRAGDAAVAQRDILDGTIDRSPRPRGCPIFSGLDYCEAGQSVLIAIRLVNTGCNCTAERCNALKLALYSGMMSPLLFGRA
jgi:hypothetical protein